jgi:hypothetical protein
MWEPPRPITPWAFTACYWNNFYMYYFIALYGPFSLFLVHNSRKIGFSHFVLRLSFSVTRKSLCSALPDTLDEGDTNPVCETLRPALRFALLRTVFPIRFTSIVKLWTHAPIELQGSALNWDYTFPSTSLQNIHHIIEILFSGE